MKPDDEHCLVTRSKCHLQLGNSQGALTDAEAALELNPKLIKVCTLKVSLEEVVKEILH